MGMLSPYYNDSYKKWQRTCRMHWGGSPAAKSLRTSSRPPRSTTCYQLGYQMKSKDAHKDLGGSMALLKAKADIVLDECARCAVLLFGGNGCTRPGQGELVEKIYHEVPCARIPDGSEHVTLDLAVRQKP
ncbi:uncharacterized protein B0I36DRAFT_335330 [Microdochium trichocladiopsis]|uniref:Acyl-CoA dehydrogenase/oxidase C-terminal domain-containing protein n=1 Tax=Microdochium trichocladiopsis TaxID=1682393 RepID=A0A9P8XU12_9PEZI|nr:uncharacterized protein B0I36DRAFT_335330 [Microdochium trichocladiopsis]KAH7018114.1 hypothetical protein B0I36DRAFT_335330 [Microdochium trichocladiopsis]